MVSHFIVFDGTPPSIKRRVSNSERSKELEIARDLDENDNYLEANKHYHKAVQISSKIRYELIQVLKIVGIDFVVSPYEADAQMAFMEFSNEVDAILTIDTDLMVYGCRRIIYDFDFKGVFKQFDSSKLWMDRKFKGFSKTTFVEMCVLAGCQYGPKVKQIDIHTAHKYFRQYKTRDRVLNYLKSTKEVEVISPQFIQDFENTVLTYKYQWVYDSINHDIVHLSKLADVDVGKDLDFLGPPMEKELVAAIAIGKVDPETKTEYKPLKATLAIQKAKAGHYNLNVRKRKKKSTEQTNTLSNYYDFLKKPQATQSSAGISAIIACPKPTTCAAAEDDGLDQDQYFLNRLKFVSSQKESGNNPYPHKFEASLKIPEYVKKYEKLNIGKRLDDVEERIAGRVMSKRV